MSRRLNKYIASFDKSIIVLFARIGQMSIISFTAVIGASIGINKCIFYSYILLDTRSDKETVKNSNRQNKKNIIKVLCQLKAS